LDSENTESENISDDKGDEQINLSSTAFVPVNSSPPHVKQYQLTIPTVKKDYHLGKRLNQEYSVKYVPPIGKLKHPSLDRGVGDTECNTMNCSMNKDCCSHSQEEKNTRLEILKMKLEVQKLKREYYTLKIDSLKNGSSCQQKDSVKM